MGRLSTRFSTNPSRNPLRTAFKFIRQHIHHAFSLWANSEPILYKAIQHLPFEQPPISSVFKAIQHLPFRQTPTSSVYKAIQHLSFGQIPNSSVSEPIYHLPVGQPHNLCHSIPSHASRAIQDNLAPSLQTGSQFNRLQRHPASPLWADFILVKSHPIPPVLRA